MNPPVSLSTLAVVVWFTTMKDKRFDTYEALKNATLTKDADLGPTAPDFPLPENETIEMVRKLMVDKFDDLLAARTFFRDITASGGIWSPDCEVKAEHILQIANLEAPARLREFLHALEVEGERTRKTEHKKHQDRQ